MDAELKTCFTLNENISLRLLTSDDTLAVFESVIRNRDHLRPYMHWLQPDYSIDSTSEFIRQNLVNVSEKNGLGLGIFRDRAFIGSIGFVGFDWAARRTEIGYWIDNEEEGKGIVSAACKLLIEYAFGDLRLNRIEIRCSSENVRSASIAERLGFTREGVLRRSEWRGGRLHDFVVYGLLAYEWRKLNL